MFLPPQPEAQQPKDFTPEGPAEEEPDLPNNVTQGYGGEGVGNYRSNNDELQQSNVGLVGNHKNINFNQTRGGPSDDDYSDDSADDNANETKGGITPQGQRQQETRRGHARPPRKGRGVVLPPNPNRVKNLRNQIQNGMPPVPPVPPVPPIPQATQYGGNPQPRPMGFDNPDQEYGNNNNNYTNNRKNDELYRKSNRADTRGDEFEDMYDPVIETDRGYSINNKNNNNKNNNNNQHNGEQIQYQSYAYNTKGKNTGVVAPAGTGLPKIGLPDLPNQDSTSATNKTNPAILPNTTLQQRGNVSPTGNPLLNNNGTTNSTHTTKTATTTLTNNTNETSEMTVPSGPGDTNDAGGPGATQRTHNGQELYKLVIMGDQNVGKTSLCLTYQTRNFPNNVPNVTDSFIMDNLTVGESRVSAEIWDTDGLQCYGKDPPLSYQNASVVILAYSITNRPSFENIKSKWVAERDFYCGGTPIVLFGLKWDLTLDSKINHDIVIKTEEGKKLADEIGAKAFVEGSAFHGRVKSMFDEAIKVAMTDYDDEDKSGCCCVLL